MWRYALAIAGLITLYSESVFAHEHWIDMTNVYPAAGETQKVFICSGHSFPESSIVLKDRVLHDAEIIKPDGTTERFETAEDTKRRSAEFSLNSNGTHIVGFALKQPQMKEPMYWVRAISVVGGTNDNERLYSTGKGLEIVPGSKVSSLKQGDKLPLVVLYNGKQIDTRLSILPEEGKSMTLSTTSKRPASLDVSEEGRYLVTTSYKGKSCSLTFAIQKAENEK